MRGNRVCIESVPHKGPKKTFCQLLVAFKMFLVVSHILHLLQPPSLADKTTRIALYDYLEREGERGVRREERGERREDFYLLTASVLAPCH